MPFTKNDPLLTQIRWANAKWFSPENKRFFGDVSYRALRGKKTGKVYLVRSTEAWTDMFGNPKRLHWRINNINQETLAIEALIQHEFKDIDAVKDWLKEN